MLPVMHARISPLPGGSYTQMDANTRERFVKAALERLQLYLNLQEQLRLAGHKMTDTAVPGALAVILIACDRTPTNLCTAYSIDPEIFIDEMIHKTVIFVANIQALAKDRNSQGLEIPIPLLQPENASAFVGLLQNDRYRFHLRNIVRTQISALTILKDQKH